MSKCQNYHLSVLESKQLSVNAYEINFIRFCHPKVMD